MPAVNVWLTVEDPDRLMDGVSPFIAAEAASIQLYRFDGEDKARDLDSGVLVTTFTLKRSTATWTADAGPWRYALYDSGQTANSWYRYRFADAGLLTFSPYSEPWDADNRPVFTLREILLEAGAFLDGSVEQGVATAGNTTTVTCASLFESTRLDPALFQDRYLMVVSNDDSPGAAPEGEVRVIDSVDTGTGVATVDRAFSAAVDANDVVMLSAVLDPATMIAAVNEAREKMIIAMEVGIALNKYENRYPAPWGIRTEADLLGAWGVRQASGSTYHQEHLFPIRAEPIFDGTRFWIDIEPNIPARLARLKVLRSYRDLEGKLTDLDDTTVAHEEWWRPAIALAMAERMALIDPRSRHYATLVDNLRSKADAATGAYGPKIERNWANHQVRSGLVGPREVR